jgi:hypothetical protein
MKKNIFISVIFVSVIGIGVLGFTEAKGSLDVMSDLELSNIYGGTCGAEMCEGAARCEKDYSPSSQYERDLIVANCDGTIEGPCDVEWGGDCVYDEYNPPYYWCSEPSPQPDCDGTYTVITYEKINDSCKIEWYQENCGEKTDCRTEGGG